MNKQKSGKFAEILAKQWIKTNFNDFIHFRSNIYYRFVGELDHVFVSRVTKLIYVFEVRSKYYDYRSDLEVSYQEQDFPVVSHSKLRKLYRSIEKLKIDIEFGKIQSLDKHGSRETNERVNQNKVFDFDNFKPETETHRTIDFEPVDQIFKSRNGLNEDRVDPNSRISKYHNIFTPILEGGVVLILLEIHIKGIYFNETDSRPLINSPKHSAQYKVRLTKVCVV